MQSKVSVRQIVVAGVLAAITVVMGWTRIGFIPVPTPAGNATIMHLPAIIGGVMEGWWVGGLLGLVFGLFSFFQAAIPMFKDPLVAILPRIFIGITAYFSYRALRRASIPWALFIGGCFLGLGVAFAYQVAAASVPTALFFGGVTLGIVAAFVYLAFRQQPEVVALTVAAIIGTLTNTILVLTMAVLRKYMTAEVALSVGLTHGIPEIIVAVVVVLAVVLPWKQIDTGRREARVYRVKETGE